MKTGERTEKKLPADAPEVAARVTGAMDLVAMTALKIRRQLSANLELDELRSMGNEGLVEAARTYQADRGVPFNGWAYLKIRGAIFDGIRRQSDLPRSIYRKLRALEALNEVRAGQIEDEAAAAGETPEAAHDRLAATAATMATALAASFLTAKRGGIESVVDGGIQSPEALTSEKILLERVLASIDRLPDDERALLTKCYLEDLPLDEAAKSIGRSKSWGSRLHARALEKVAKDLKKRKIENDA